MSDSMFFMSEFSSCLQCIHFMSEFMNKLEECLSNLRSVSTSAIKPILSDTEHQPANSTGNLEQVSGKKEFLPSFAHWCLRMESLKCNMNKL
jgi:hypothetical protein